MASIRDLWKNLRVGRGVNELSNESRDALSELQVHCSDLEERLRWCDSQLRERTEKLYALQQQYSTEHFTLYESMRDLKTERLRNAGAYASLDTILMRARQLQDRIHDLKIRLCRHEDVEDLYFDTEPIFIEDGEKK